ncbi:MAG: CapA family protein [Rikenella sp.]|nr:CapA family protein [Rikenella sp.]
MLLLLCGCSACREQVERRPLRPRESSLLDSIVLPGREELTLVFSGDVMQHLPQVAAAQKEDGTYDYSDCFRYVRPFWEEADWAIVNLETTLSQRGPYSGYPRFASPTALVGALKEAGVDVAVLANNHCCDRGLAGIRTTVRTVDSLGLRYGGVYVDSARAERPLILSKKGFRVALLNATYGTNGLPVPKGTVVHGIDTIRMAAEIRRARQDSAATHVVLFVHWGEEYQRRPNAAQREVAAWCRKQGIDAVIGSHPHVAQPVDTAARVVWSLGNFVSNQRNRYQDGGLNVRVRLARGRSPEVEIMPHWVWCPTEEGRRRYYVVPAYVSGREIGMDSLTNRAFRQALEDNRTVAGAVNEVVL